MRESATLYLTKAQEALAGVQSEFVNGRYNNVANRAYYACYQAAIQTLEEAGSHRGLPGFSGSTMRCKPHSPAN